MAASNNLFNLEAIDRLASIPLVGSSFKTAEHIYNKVRNNNRLFSWYFETAEATIFAACESVQPALKLFGAPLKHLDNVMCKSLDILEQRIPLVYLPPEMMYWNTKEYMSDHIVKPVLKRADSVKQIRNAMLENPLTTFAADRIDGAFTAGDKFVDKYLVPIATEKDVAPNDDENVLVGALKERGAIKAIHHGQRFSRKLKRRLTQRTIAEVRAFKKQGEEAINVLIYAAELIATDPKMALQKAKELWEYLSQDEPENQARPDTLEQLIVLITRESARHVVHFANYSASVAANIPRVVIHTTTDVVHHFIYFNNRALNVTKLEKSKNISNDEREALHRRILSCYNSFFSKITFLTNDYLEHFATFLSGRIEAEKVSGRNTTSVSSAATQRRRIEDTSSSAQHNNINGVY